MKNQNQAYFVPEIVDFLNIHFSEEEFSRKISNCRDVQQLLFYLEIKQYLMRKHKSTPINFPFEEILKFLNTYDNVEKKCLCLFIVFDILNNPCALNSFISQLEYSFTEVYKSNCYAGDIIIALFKYLIALLDICNEMKEYESVQNNMTIFESHILNFILHLDNKMKQYVKVYVLPKYFLCVKTNNLLKQIWKHIVDTNDVNLLCIYSNFFITIDKEKYSSNGFEIVEEDQFWTLIQNSLLDKTSVLQKQSLFLLKLAIDKLYNDYKHLNILSKLNIIDPILNDALYDKWKIFFIILELSKEKQLHLLKPAFDLINNLKELHPSWKKIIYLQLLSHPQDVVIALSVLNILSSNIYILNTEFTCIIFHLLTALNNTFLYSPKYKENITSKLISLFTNVSKEQLGCMLDKSVIISWAPIPLYYFYKCLRESNVIKKYKIIVHSNVLTQLDKLPHYNCRLACFLILRDILYFSSENSSFINNQVHYQLSMRMHKIENLSEIMAPKFEFQINNDIYQELENIVTQIENKVFLNPENVESFMHYLCHIQNLTHYKFSNENPKFCDFLSASLLKRIESNFFSSSFIYTMLPTLIIILHKEQMSFTSITTFIENEIRFHKCSIIQSKLLCKILKQLIGLNVKCLDNIFSFVKEIILQHDIQKGPGEVSLAFELMEIAVLNSYIKVDEAFLQCLNAWREYLMTSQNNGVLKSFLNILQYSQHFFKCDQILSTINVAIETQNTMEIIVPALKGLKIIMDTSDYTENISETLRKCFKAILEIKNTPNFLKSVNYFVKIIFHPNIRKFNNCLEDSLNFANELLEVSATVPSVAKILSNQLQALINISDLVVVSKYLNIIKKLLLFGNILRRDQRIEFNLIISENWTFQYSNMYNDICITRAIAINIIIDLIKRPFSDEKVKALSNLLDLLLEEYKLTYKKRYFKNSQVHLTKLRIMQIFLVLKSFIIEDQAEVFINFLTKSLLEESHQHSVKNIIQLLLTNLLLKCDHKNRLAVLNKQMENLETMQNSAIISFIPVIFYLGMYTFSHDQYGMNDYLNLLGPLTMGPQFNVRLHAQYAYSKMVEQIEIVDGDNFYSNILQVLKFTKINDANAHIQFLYDSRHVVEVDDIFTIYCDIPRIYGVDKYEWRYLEDYFGNIFQSADKNNRRFLDYVAVNLTEDDATEINLLENLSPKESETGFLQRKIAPWMDEMISNEFESNRKTAELIVVASLIDRAPNLGGLSRTCDIFGVKQYVLSSLHHLKDKEFQSLSMSSENWINAIEVKPNQLQNYLLTCKENGYSIVGVEQTSNSVLLPDFKFNKKTVILLGHEKEGIPPNLLPLMDTCVEIPQFGVVRSLNVHVAGALLIWEYTRAHLVN